jgi:hypothetical protein
VNEVAADNVLVVLAQEQNAVELQERNAKKVALDHGQKVEVQTVLRVVQKAGNEVKNVHLKQQKQEDHAEVKFLLLIFL